MPNIKIVDPAANLPYGYVEDKESGEEGYNWTEGVITAKRIFKGPWENRQLFLRDFYLQVNNSGDGENLIFAPAMHPELFIPAVSARVVGKCKTSKNDITNYIKHEVAVIEVEYSSQKNNGSGPNDISNPNNDLTNQYLEEYVESSIELYPINLKREIYTGETTTSPSDDKPIVGYNQVGTPLYPIEENWQEFLELQDVTRNVRIIKINYRLSIPYVIDPPWARISNNVGTVNWIPFITPSGLVAPIETLRYDGITGVTKREISQNRLVWALDFMFQYYKYGHNTIPTADFINKKSTNTYIKHQRIAPLLFYPYPMQALFRNLTSSELITMESNFGGTGAWGGLNNILIGNHLE